MAKRAAMTIALMDGPTVSETALKLLWALDRDGITVTLDANGEDLTLTPVEKVKALPYFKRLPEYKAGLLALIKYVTERERKADDLRAGQVRWK